MSLSLIQCVNTACFSGIFLSICFKQYNKTYIYCIHHRYNNKFYVLLSLPLFVDSHHNLHTYFVGTTCQLNQT